MVFYIVIFKWSLLNMIMNLFFLYLVGYFYWMVFVNVNKGWFRVMIGICFGLRNDVVFFSMFILCFIIVGVFVFLKNRVRSVVIVGGLFICCWFLEW